AERDKALVDVVHGIKAVVKSLRAAPLPRPERRGQPSLERAYEYQAEVQHRIPGLLAKSPAGGFSSGRALVIGVGADLPGTVADACGIAQLLKDPQRAGYGQVELLTEGEATGKRILAALDALAGCSPDDTVLIYFSGHG